VGTQIRFWQDAYKNDAKSKEAGMPVFDTVPWCEIRVLGESDNVRGPWHKMPPHVHETWRASFDHWQKDNSTEGIIGTLLEAVPWLERGDVETLRHAGIRTLENLAAITDTSIGKIPGGLALRKKAAEMLAAAKDGAPLQRLADELAKRDAEIAALKVQIADVLAEKRKRKE
jgi:hypothetical protein